MLKKNNLLLLLLLITTISFSQVNEVAPPDYIKTITFKGKTNESQLPVIELGDFIELEFDALNGDEDDYYYKIEHYNYDWTPSVLMKQQYIDGYDEQRIRNWENSINTYQIYSHYQLKIPNQFTRKIKTTGNYIITIYNDDDEVVFTRKFMIYEKSAYVGVEAKRSRDINYLNKKQRVDITIRPKDTPFNNPLQTIKTVIIQNNDLSTAIYNLKPQYTIGNELIYRYNNETSFWAGNEFINFETKDLRAATYGVSRIELTDIYNSYLFTRRSRANSKYTYSPDINGNFVVTTVNTNNPNTAADYTRVHFSLNHEQLNEGEHIHIYGNFNNYAIDNSTRMVYNEEENLYKLPYILKQGFYNYRHIIVNDHVNTVDRTIIGGDFWQTENNYKVLVYYRDLGARYDKLIGLGETDSVKITN